ncbi:MAG: hypothetical protein EBQ94_02085, partial [Flavobacteriales bacterium]|nr:hypothetical protein [Flavobacteriales bacterium]
MRRELPDTNKVILPVHGTALIHHILNYYSSQEIFNQFILCLGSDLIQIKSSIENSKNYRNLSWNGISMKMIDTGEDSTATNRINQVLSYIPEDFFFLTYADIISNIDFKKLLSFHGNFAFQITMTLTKAKMPYGRVFINENGQVIGLEEKPILEDLINAGYFILEKSVFSLGEANLEFESEFLPNLIVKKVKFGGYYHNDFWLGIDTYKDYVFLNDNWEI